MIVRCQGVRGGQVLVGTIDEVSEASENYYLTANSFTSRTLLVKMSTPNKHLKSIGSQKRIVKQFSFATNSPRTKFAAFHFETCWVPDLVSFEQEISKNEIVASLGVAESKRTKVRCGKGGSKLYLERY